MIGVKIRLRPVLDEKPIHEIQEDGSFISRIDSIMCPGCITVWEEIDGVTTVTSK